MYIVVFSPVAYFWRPISGVQRMYITGYITPHYIVYYEALIHCFPPFALGRYIAITLTFSTLVCYTLQHFKPYYTRIQQSFGVVGRIRHYHLNV